MSGQIQHTCNPFLLSQPPATDHSQMEGGHDEHPEVKDTYGKEVINCSGWHNNRDNLYAQESFYNNTDNRSLVVKIYTGM